MDYPLFLCFPFAYWLHIIGWRAFRIQGELDFSLIGILSRISGLLAENEIGIFAISTFNTDYILTEEENYLKALKVLEEAGYCIEEQ